MPGYTSSEQANRWIPVHNNAATDVPPYGLMRITGVNGNGVAEINQPNANGQVNNILVNGSTAIPGTNSITGGGYGSGHNSYPCVIAYDSAPISEGSPRTPANGESWGTKSGSWLLSFGGRGFLIVGGADTTNRVVNADGRFFGHKIRGKMDADLVVGGSASMSVWAVTDGTNADTVENLTVYDWLLTTGQTIWNNCKVTAFYDTQSGRYYVDSAECPCTTTTTTTTTTSTTTTSTTTTSTTTSTTTTSTTTSTTSTTTTSTSTTTTSTSTTSTTTTSTTTTSTTTTSTTTTTTAAPCPNCLTNPGSHPCCWYRCVGGVWTLDNSWCTSGACAPTAGGCGTPNECTQLGSTGTCDL